MNPAQKQRLLLAIPLLLLAAAVFLAHADALSMWFDELWAVLHARGGFSSILLNRDVNWPPGYYLALHGWMQFVGSHDLLLRLFGVFCGLLATALMIAIGRQLGADRRADGTVTQSGTGAGLRAGGLAGLAFICSDYALYFVLEVRGYTLMLALMLAVVWLHLRWFARPSLRRALPYLLAQTALVYVQFTSGVVVALLGLRVVLAAPPGKRWRCTAAWVGIMLGTGLLFLPLLPQFLLVNRANANVIATTGSPGIDLDASLGWVLRALSARQEVVFVLLLALALGGLLLATWRGGRVRRANTLWLLVWALGLPAFAFVTLAPAGLFTPRYLLPALPGLLLLVGVGLAGWRAVGRLAGRLAGSVPVWGGVVLLLLLLAAPWQPFDFRPDYSTERPVRDLLRELAARAQPGDVLLLDPLCDCANPYGWSVYEPVYFPSGSLRRGPAALAGAARVWYVTVPGRSDGALRSAVERGRIAAQEASGWWQSDYLELRLFMRPPVQPEVRLQAPAASAVPDVVLRFAGYELPGGSLYEPGATLHLSMWWRVDAALPLDYSFGVYLINRRTGLLLVQDDSAPQGLYAPPQTTLWQPQIPYRDDRTLLIPQQAGAGFYDLLLAVYYWRDGVRFVPRSANLANANLTAVDAALRLAVIEISTFNLPD